MWQYRAKLVSIVDGDTIDVLVDVGFHMLATVRLRLLGVNTYELHDPDPGIRLKAISGKNFLCKLSQTSGEWPLKVETQKSDAFGRWLANVWYTDRDGKEGHINQELLDSGLAIPYQRKR